MNADKKTIKAPPWLTRLMTPMIARIIAREMVKKYPGLGANEIIAKMRAEANPSDEAGQRVLNAVALRLPASPAPAVDPQAAPAVDPQAAPAVDPQAAPAADPRAAICWLSPSSLALIAANLLPLYGILVFGWPVFPLLLLFWLENVVIGMLNALRMLLVDPTDFALWALKLFMVPFFCFHYGMFTAIHGSFVMSLFGGKAYAHLDRGFIPMEGAIRAVGDFELGLAVAALAASHVFSFLWNYLIRGEFRRASLRELMGQPYKRVFVLHITIIFGGGIAMALGSPLWALLLLIALKIGFDVNAHIREHARPVA